MRVTQTIEIAEEFVAQSLAAARTLLSDRGMAQCRARVTVERDGDRVHANVLHQGPLHPEFAGWCTRVLGSFFRRHPRKIINKVFGVGLPRTGTTSLDRFLHRQGYLSWHYFPWLGSALRAGDASALVNVCKFLDAAVDSPIPLAWRQLRDAYPGSRFILTTRNRDTWLKSTQTINGDEDDDLRYLYFGTVDPGKEDFVAGYEQHHERVRGYFAGSDDYFELDLDQLDTGVPELCRFLELPATSADIYPHLNAARSRVLPENSPGPIQHDRKR